jgi:UDPglucose 6-dehydrogenase
MLAAKISLMNEIANIAEAVNADIEKVRQGIALDVRIGPHFIAPGCGYGGSCFPKDVKALIHLAEHQQVAPPILRAVDTVNQTQKKRLVKKIQQHFQHRLTGLTFALWGLSFKPNTDDMREACSLVLIDELTAAGATIQAYDPKAMGVAEKIYRDNNSVVFCDTALQCLANSAALIVVTEWPEFKNIDLHVLRNAMANPLIFDGRNLYHPKHLQKLGITYCSIGRPTVPVSSALSNV